MKTNKTYQHWLVFGFLAVIPFLATVVMGLFNHTMHEVCWIMRPVAFTTVLLFLGIFMINKAWKMRKKMLFLFQTLYGLKIKVLSGNIPSIITSN